MLDLASCTLCRGNLETELRLLRDCCHAKSIRDQFDIPHIPVFYDLNGVGEWISVNIDYCGRSRSELNVWPAIFGVTIWMIWKQRNYKIFQGVEPNRNSVLAQVKQRNYLDYCLNPKRKGVSTSGNNLVGSVCPMDGPNLMLMVR